MGNTYPDGFGAEIFSRRVLRDVSEKAVGFDDREHVTLFIWKHQELYSIGTFAPAAEIARPEIRLDVDVPGDLAKLNQIIERVKKINGRRENLFRVSALEIIKAYG